MDKKQDPIIRTRQARESDRKAIAATIANAFKYLFDTITKENAKVEALLGEPDVIDIDMFSVLEVPKEGVKHPKKDSDWEIASVAGISGRRARAVTLDWKKIRKHLSLPTSIAVRTIAALDTNRPGTVPGTGLVEYIAVSEKYRGKGTGFAEETVRYAIENSMYEDFILWVKPNNDVAQKIYDNIGFIDTGKETARKVSAGLGKLKILQVEKTGLKQNKRTFERPCG